jgi:PAS domain S-box-containing protein
MGRLLKVNKIRILFFLMLVLITFSGCKKLTKDQPISIENISFTDIPGITQDEINAIEALKKKHSSFVYGMSPSTEAFLDKDGVIRGYSSLFCEWLTRMFGIKFETKFYDWGDLIRELESGDVDFTGELMIDPERKKTYFMTDSIAERELKIYRIKGSEPLENIIKTRQPKYAFFRGSVLVADVTENAEYKFVTVYINDYNTVYNMLKNDEVDAYFGMDTSDAAFAEFGDVVTEDFYPLIFKSACLSARRAELAPIINAVEKVLDTRTLYYLTGLYKEGHQQYLENKLHNLLTEEEKAYIQNNPVIQFAAEFNNYPINFFDTNTNKWHGIYFDTLDEVTKLTGLKFEHTNDQNTHYEELIAMLENGKVLIVPELSRLKEYEGRFLWSDVPLLWDTYAFLSKLDFKDIEISQIPYLKIGVRKNRYSEFFRKMFPNHRYLTEYDTQEEAWTALKHGDVELIFACNRKLITYTNFYEEAGYKLNLILNYSFDSSFGYNKDALLLKSILDKTLSIININNITNQWMHKTYDYRYKLAETQRPWLTGLLIMFFFVIITVSFSLLKTRSTGKQLEVLVNERTSELSFKTAQLQMMIDSIPDLMFCKDINLKYTQCNKHFENFSGLREADIIGKTDAEGSWLLVSTLENIAATEQAVIKEVKIFKLDEFVSSPNTGKACYFETVKAPLIRDGIVVGVMVIARDISERKKMEKEIAYQTTLLETMIDSIPDGIFCKDLDFKYTMCNNYIANMFGKKKEDILGKNDMEGLGMGEEAAALTCATDKKVVYEYEQVMYEEWLVCGDGVKRLFETAKLPLVLFGEIIGILGIGRDITKRKIMEDEIRAASQAKTDFLANMSHEIRTPLNVIIGLTDLVLEDEHLGKNVMENLVKISNAGTTLLSIVNDILDLSKIESGKLKISPINYYISSLLNDVITLVMARLGEKPVSFHLNINDDLPSKLYGDDLRVKQILINILTNSVKYTHQGKIELTVNCIREGDTVCMEMTVSDTGVGIREEDIKKLFLDYFQVNAKANRYIEGTGLGLPITKKLVDMMDGEINVESEFGKGTTFRLRIKQGYVDDETIDKELAEKLRNFSYADNKRVVNKRLLRVNLDYAKVLVVDDMQTNLDVAVGLLSKYKMQVDCLNNGPDAIDRIRMRNPVYNAIFMDHMMPGMDGVETADKIREIGTEYAQKIPIIALTANAIHGTEEMFYKHGFQGFISKPIDVMEMDSVLRKWVRNESIERSRSANESEVIMLNGSSSDSENTNIEINIPGVDAKRGLSLYAGEMDIYMPLLRSYAANTPTVLNKLKSVSKETLSDYVISVHGLKGTSAGIGAQNVREKALELENLSRAGNLDEVLAKNNNLIKDAEFVVSNVKAWLEQYDSMNAKPRQKSPNREVLASLRQSCEKFNMSGIDKAMSELEKYDYDEGADLIAWLKEKINISEITEVATRLAKEGLG